ncbi:hypothetical protein LEP1GSC052_0897 [Leptospira kmetyi serovar Malaysia str. Bejo-Iso9]|nr:hypothetical protein LEP1GSC052_0897 [Leptospira kmetyi serovar Malaysia str. Bejo-Iso9]
MFFDRRPSPENSLFRAFKELKKLMSKVVSVRWFFIRRQTHIFPLEFIG